ncbi:MAG: nicotinamide riboside transporter PnuC [Vicinamibacteria bacterium]
MSVEAPVSNSRENIILAVLTIGVGIVAAVMVAQGRSTPLEGVAFVTGAICVWLTVKGNVWTFPLAIINVSAYFFVFLKARIYGDMALQVVYLVLNLMGWYMWLFGGEKHTALKIRHSGRNELIAVGVLIPVIAVALWRTLIYLGGSASLGDAVTTSISLGAQWLMNRKLVENWHLWIIADILYVPLYITRNLHLTAILYAVFLVMAVIGLFEWKAQAKETDVAV